MTKFEEGNGVEVYKRNDRDQYGGWFPATILLVNGHKYTVRYDLLLTPEGNAVVEVVSEENVRPQPLENNKARWVDGDIAEVFDQHSWRVGKIAKVVKNGCVVMKIFGSIQLKKFHSSSLRIQLTWRDNRWIVTDKVHGEQDVNGVPENAKLFDNAARRKQDHHDSSHMPVMKRKLSSYFKLGPENIAEGTSKRIKRNSYGDGSHRRVKDTRHTKVDAISFPKNLVAENFLHKPREGPRIRNTFIRDNRSYFNNRNINNQAGYSYLNPLDVSEENIECSVASCSANQFHGYTNDKNRYRSKNTNSKLLDDAVSSCQSDNANGNRSISAEELAASIHELELYAYRKTMQALYASGPMSWEQQSLLTNLRLCLNISSEEHLLHLKHLLSV